MSMEREIQTVGAQARGAANALVSLSAEQRNNIILSMADELNAARATVLEANALDVSEAKKAGLAPAMLDRLTLDEARYAAMVSGLRELVSLPDKLGEELSRDIRPNGLDISKVRVPIGVIAIVYESRPNVTADAAGLCMKTSNAVVLRGGRESIRSNTSIAAALQRGGERAGLPPKSIQLIETTDRDAVRVLVQLEDSIDLVIPRGGEGLIRAVAEMARVPVLKHYKGVCHTYVDRSADLEMALSIAENAKCQRPGVCNAMETLLVHEAVSETFLPKLAERLAAAGVELRGDAQVCALVPECKPAAEDDWEAEYLALILAVKVVGSAEEAIAHINQYGSGHTDALVAEDLAVHQEFLQRVDTGVVMLNASSRFNDGAEFGLGAEMGISTDKLHARGPVGAEGLTTYKWIVRGSGQIRT